MHFTIGVVEDSDEDFEGLRRIVARAGFDVTLERWTDAEALLAEAEREPGRTAWPDLLLIDLNLPGIDGSALVARLRDGIRTRPLPLFILSGSAGPTDVDRSYAAGASLYLTKPLKPEHVQAAVDLLSATPKRRG